MNTSQRNYFAGQMRDPAYRAALIEQHLRRSLPAQIRAMREEREWSQDELGKRCGKSQEWISRLENPSYGRYSIQTLIELAAGFDVALTAQFVSFGDWLDWYVSRTSHGGVPSFGDDPGFASSLKQTGTKVLSFKASKAPADSDATFVVSTELELASAS